MGPIGLLVGLVGGAAALLVNDLDEEIDDGKDSDRNESPSYLSNIPLPKYKFEDYPIINKNLDKEFPCKISKPEYLPQHSLLDDYPKNFLDEIKREYERQAARDLENIREEIIPRFQQTQDFAPISIQPMEIQRDGALEALEESTEVFSSGNGKRMAKLRNESYFSRHGR